MTEKLMPFRSGWEHYVKYVAREKMEIKEHRETPILIIKNQRNSARHISKIKHKQRVR